MSQQYCERYNSSTERFWKDAVGQHCVKVKGVFSMSYIRKPQVLHRGGRSLVLNKPGMRRRSRFQ